MGFSTRRARRATFATLLVAGFGALAAGSPSPAAATGCDDAVTCLDQGWADHERSWWYTVSQGSRLLPLSWMLALEQPGSRDKLLAEANLRRLRYLPNPVSEDNPYGLPVGFAVDLEEGGRFNLMCGIFGRTCGRDTMREPWVGLNCAACHTAEFTFGDATIRVDGGPTLADFEGLTGQIRDALAETLDDQAKFDRFASAVVGSSSSARADLLDELEEQVAWQTRLHQQNSGAVAYGYGRLDAQGHILNKVALIVGAEPQSNDFKADAPSSYPFIWNAPQHDKVQWNGLARNGPKIRIGGRETDLGAIARNTGEVIGVFAHVDVDESAGWRGYRSSLRLMRLIEIERQLGRLRSPVWPADILGPIDQAAAASGKAIFADKCQSCHAPLAAADLETPIKASMQSLSAAGTDIFLACNAYLHESKAGKLEGRREKLIVGGRIEAVAPTRVLLEHTIYGVIAGRADELAARVLIDIFRGLIPFDRALEEPSLDFLPGVVDPVKKRQAQICLTERDEILAYKARPLNGVWSTAPYLHNGSVPTLYDLLLPALVRNTAPKIPGAEEPPPPSGNLRPDAFFVGNREFDPRKVGLVSEDDPESFQFRVFDELGTPIPGNYNSGHNYGTAELSEEQRLQLVEYLKTL